MLGSMISKIRQEKHMTKVELSKKTNINIGHLTHIEKGERNPSHKTLKLITDALGIPYKILSNLYDKQITEDDKRCKMADHLSYNEVLLVDSFSDFIECPANVPNASIAFKIQNNVMEPHFLKGSYAFLELNVPLDNNDVGLFKYNDSFVVRRFIILEDKLVLRADNKLYEDIVLSEDDNFIIIGKLFSK